MKAFQKVFSLSGGLEAGPVLITLQRAGSRLKVSGLRGSWETGAVNGHAGGGSGLDWRPRWWEMEEGHRMW